MPKSSALSLAIRPKGGKDVSTPMSPASFASQQAANGDDSNLSTPVAPYHNTPQSPASPKLRKDSKNIFANFSASKSSSRLNGGDGSVQHSAGRDGKENLYPEVHNGGSTPDLNRPAYSPNTGGDTADPEERGIARRSTEGTDHGAETHKSRRPDPKSKKQGGVLSRSRSIKVEEGGRAKFDKPLTPKLSPDPSATWTHDGGDGAALKTAPLEKDRTWRQNMPFSKLRTHSADRHDGSQHAHRGDDDSITRRDRAEQTSLVSGSYNERRGAQLMSNIGSGARKMGEKIDSARKGVFGKLGRSSSNHEREFQVPKEQYQFKIIHTPLVEQTRLTRISSRLENSKDKTEFWMPALPWRCIDYLNMKGCEEEGLYRVPGAAHQIRYYEQKFDQVRDIDLIADDNLNDPNVIGSLFKNWLRQLPDEIFPKAIQARIQQECQGAKTTPQMLKDELSKLPPFNYYLLFAITCHISLLHSCSEFNKMNYNNLCICFQPAIKIDAFCFYFLILDWRNCWQGCWTEKEYLAEEVKLLESLEAQANAQSAPARAGPANGKGIGSQSSAYLGDNFKPSSSRSESTDRAKSSSIRGISSDRSLASGRATPPHSSLLAGDKSSNTRRGPASHREQSVERAPSSSDSREAFNARVTPQRAPPALQPEIAEDGDDQATPTQAQTTQASEREFRLDLSNPPGSPFDIKF